ncbi:MAG: GTPase domain-containing protein [Anaerolineae bacterium]|nr:GTPase domain-containing protein [Anaerolineae bacterium]
MFINWKKREINLNIVYYGPALSGKTTNLEQIHARTNPQIRSDLFTLNTHEDRTIFFDFMQLEMAPIGGLRPKFGLYTVPGQVYYESTREAVLRRADGVVFVADSQAQRWEDNLKAWGDMKRHLAGMGYTLARFPVVVQFNKRDLPNVSPVEEMKTAMRAAAYPCIEAAAVKGIGVPQTLQTAMRLVMADTQRKLTATQAKGSGS